MDEACTAAWFFYGTVEDDLTLYAKWIISYYSKNYHFDGGTNHVNNPDGFNFDTDTITLQNPTRNGFNFGGWYSNNSLTVKSNRNSLRFNG